MTDTNDRFHSVEKSLRRIEDKLDSSTATVEANTTRLLKVESQVQKIREEGNDEQTDQ